MLTSTPIVWPPSRSSRCGSSWSEPPKKQQARVTQQERNGKPKRRGPPRALYRSSDWARVHGPSGERAYRRPARRDYARLIHCPAFRRLQGKTQLFPGVESDFFRNRLTHSLEVAQIAKSIALKLNCDSPYFQRHPLDLDLVETAALAHDLGHPPFGHRELDVPCWSSGNDGRRETVLFVIEEETEPRRFSRTGWRTIASTRRRCSRRTAWCRWRSSFAAWRRRATGPRRWCWARSGAPT